MKRISQEDQGLLFERSCINTTYNVPLKQIGGVGEGESDKYAAEVS